MSAHVASPSMLDSGQRHHELVATVHCRQIWHVHLGKPHLQVSGCEISRLPRCWPCQRVLYRVGKATYLHYGPNLCLSIISLILAQHVSLPTAGARLVAVAATLLSVDRVDRRAAAGSSGERSHRGSFRHHDSSVTVRLLGIQNSDSVHHGVWSWVTCRRPRLPFLVKLERRGTGIFVHSVILRLSYRDATLARCNA
jgi:hypothetical protein